MQRGLDKENAANAVRTNGKKRRRDGEFTANILTLSLLKRGGGEQETPRLEERISSRFGRSKSRSFAPLTPRTLFAGPQARGTQDDNSGLENTKRVIGQCGTG